VGVLTFGVVVLGADDVPRAVGFWRQALGYEPVEGGFGGWANVLAPPAGGPGGRLALQGSETSPQTRPRLHLDLHVADAAEQAAEVRRLVALGARQVAWDDYPADPDFVVLADPEDNLFCVVDLGHG
jgi:catechol 2,3-dioxygenase-like lactoylglutathione lyase family enzyme